MTKGALSRHMRRRWGGLEQDSTPCRWRRGREAEGTRLLNEHTPKGYRGFESLRLRHHPFVSHPADNPPRRGLGVRMDPGHLKRPSFALLWGINIRKQEFCLPLKCERSMSARRGLTGLAIGLACGLSACSTDGATLWSYAPGSGVAIKARCSAYLVALHPNGSKLLVTPYAGNVVRPICEGIRGARDVPSKTGVAFEEGAREYLAANRPTCRVVAGERLTPLHSEFTFACTESPKPRSTVK